MLQLTCKRLFFFAFRFLFIEEYVIEAIPASANKHEQDPHQYKHEWVLVFVPDLSMADETDDVQHGENENQ